MTDMQLLTLALAVIVPLGLLLLSNSRISDTKETLRGSISEAKETLRAELQTLRTEMGAKHAEVMAGLDRIAVQVKAIETSLESKLRIHELEHHR
jgi:Sec-independent protein translocase protein TatA